MAYSIAGIDVHKAIIQLRAPLEGDGVHWSGCARGRFLDKGPAYVRRGGGHSECSLH
jgi:hypothetical protein